MLYEQESAGCQQEEAMPLERSTVLITGAGRGLGRALALALAARGARVVVNARSTSELDATVHAIEARGGTAFALPADIADKSAIYPLLGEAAALAGPIDVLINNASTLGPTPLRSLLDTDCADLERALAVNLLGPFRLSKAVLGSMLVRGQGVVVNISSDAAQVAYPSWGAYGVSKAALDHLTRSFAAELAADSGVRIFAVDPGEMDTRMHADAVPDADRNQLARPEAVAEQIVNLIERPERAPNGSRLAAPDWKLSS
jgi:NAD(P)-dependent dehydrogenase (short-subunit alcohol dehydrogenase family)